MKRGYNPRRDRVSPGFATPYKVLSRHPAGYALRPREKKTGNSTVPGSQQQAAIPDEMCGCGLSGG